jgi:hypothetical protein
MSDRRVSQGEVKRYLADMQREIGDLERRLDSLRAAAGKAVGRVKEAGTSAAAVLVGRKRRRRANITPEQRASRQLQGRYLGLIRQIPASKRNQYKKTAQEKGREAAIKEMVAVLGK